MGVLAHQQVGVQRHAVAGRGQVEERTHRHVDLVAYAGRLEQYLGRILGNELAGQAANHVNRPFRKESPLVEKPPSRLPCAWQIAQASASAASGLGSPGSASSLFTMCCT